MSNRIGTIHGLRRQSGMGMFGWIAIVFMVGTLGLIGLRLIPAYSDYFYVLDVARGIVSDPSLSKKTKSEMKIIVATRFRQNNLYDMEPGVLKFSKNKAQRLVVTIDYERRVHVFGNLDMVASFDKIVYP